MAKYILGIDEGTTGARAFVIDDRCEVLGLAAELTQHYPRPGWIEHDPIEILNVQLEVIRKALREPRSAPSAASCSRAPSTPG
jgi:glycerol kinase